MRPFREVVEESCRILSTLRIRYVIVGGVAAIAFGRIRTTSDVDVIVDIRPARVPTFVEAFRARDFAVSSDDVLDALRERAHFSIHDRRSPYRIDCKGVYGVRERRAIAERRRARIGRVFGYLDSPENLIVMKLLFGSDQDVADAEAVYVRQGQRLNHRRVGARARSLGVGREWAALKARLDQIVRDERRKS